MATHRPRLIVTAFVVGIALIACGSSRGPSGYERIGVADGATVFAKRISSSRMSVVLRSDDGHTLCSGSGPLSPKNAPAVCDISASDAYSFVLALDKSAKTFPMFCDRYTGAGTAVQRLRGPADWPTDFAVAVRQGSSTGIMPCPR